MDPFGMETVEDPRHTELDGGPDHPTETGGGVLKILLTADYKNFLALNAASAKLLVLYPADLVCSQIQVHTD